MWVVYTGSLGGQTLDNVIMGVLHHLYTIPEIWVGVVGVADTEHGVLHWQHAWNINMFDN